MRIAFITLALVVSMACHAAAAGLVDDINGLRLKGCRNHAGVAAALTASRELDAVAKQWARGGRLRDALAATGYRAANSASMRIEGAPNRAALLQAISDNYCETVTNPLFTSVGVSQTAQVVHIVVALPLVAPPVSDARAVSEEALALVNAARAQPRKCGNKSFPAATPLQRSAMLTQAALVQAQDMAKHNFFEHEGSDGSTVGVRVSRVGYVWKSVGENIATGPTTAQEVVRGWLDSPGHCANIMSASFTEMGLAFATNPKSSAFIYWSQVFATPLPVKK